MQHCEYIDSPPCDRGDECLEFNPLKIATIHIVNRTTEGLRMLCLPDRNMPLGDIMMTSHVSAATCVRCIKACKEETKPLQTIESLYSTDSSEYKREDYKSMSWMDLGLPEELLAIMLSKNISAFDFRENLLNTNNNVDVSDEYTEILLASLELERK